jgi:dihydrofolate synthase/folylpolyglutamate synthase
MSRSGLDDVILEVGLGGRLDAVNIIDPDCAVITSIDLDHMELLGLDREQIGVEKVGIMRTGRPVIVADPKPPQSVLDHAAAIHADLWCFGVDFHVSSSESQWDWEGRGLRLGALAYPALRGTHQLVNAAGVLAALGALRARLPVSDQAVRQGLARVALPGRFQFMPGSPVLVLDVAHSPRSVAALATNLEAMGQFATTHAVFGAMADKDLAPMLAYIKPLIDKWYFTDLPTPRAASGAELLRRWEIQNTRPDASASARTAPELALQAALKAAVPIDRIVVFDSYYAVGGVLHEVRECARA